jgi:hypothetical protein
MGRSHEPPEYGARKKTSKLSERLREGGGTGRSQYEKYQERKERLVEDHIKRSVTKRAIDIFFLVALVTIGVQFSLAAMSMDSLLGPIGHLPRLFLLPITLLWNPEEPSWMLGTILLSKVHVIGLCFYLVAYGTLVAVHRQISEQRTFVPK